MPLWAIIALSSSVLCYLGLNIWCGWTSFPQIWRDRTLTAAHRLFDTAIIVLAGFPRTIMAALRQGWGAG